MTVVKKFHRIILIFALLALLVFVINGVSAEDTANLNDISTVSADANSITLNHELNSSNSLYQNQVNMQDDLEDNNQLDSMETSWKIITVILSFPPRSFARSINFAVVLSKPSINVLHFP